MLDDALSKRFSTQAGLGFAFVTAITIAVVAGSVFSIHATAGRRAQILERYSDNLVHASQMQAAADQMVAAGRGYLLTGESELLKRIDDAERRLESCSQALSQQADSTDEQDLLRHVVGSAERYRWVLDDLLRLPRPAPRDQQLGMSVAIKERLLPARDDLGREIDALVAMEQQLQSKGRLSAKHMLDRELQRLSTLGALGIALSVLLAWSFTRTLSGLYRSERQATGAAKRAVEAREETLAMVAHDLRNPLNAIMLKATLFNAYPASEKAREAATSIARVASRMDDIIEALLDSASIEAGRLSVAKEPCGVQQIFLSVHEIFDDLAKSRSIHLTHTLELDSLVVCGDRGRLLRLIGNLVGNALKFTPEGGDISIHARQRADVIEFEVRDSGPGIPPGKLDRIFERYWKGELGARGTGLGLYIARGIAEAHGGRIWVETSVGKGASFYFEIPAAPPRSQGVASVGVSPKDDQPRTHVHLS